MKANSYLICPNPFKGTYTALQAARLLARKVRQADPQARISLLPLADGGPGTLEAVHAARGGQWRKARVRGPLGKTVRARWLKLGRIAVIESAEAIGLQVLKSGRGNAKSSLQASSFGLGQLILAAQRAGCREIWIGLGGSCTSDGGKGMAQALGWRFLDNQGSELKSGGKSLVDLATALPSNKKLFRTRIHILSDVKNQLNGPQGAARIFSPQKGAGPREVKILQRGLARLSKICGGKQAKRAGAGAAGGLGYGLLAFAGARMEPGADTLMKWAGFSARLKHCDILVTGEGCFDRSSSMGKLPWRLAQAGLKANKKVWIVAGQVAWRPRLKDLTLIDLKINRYFGAL